MLVIERLHHRFGSHTVVESLSFSVDPGERVALVGPNGSGKTTILRCLTGTVIPTGGRLTVGGHPAGSLAARRLIGVSLSQERSFYLRLSGHSNLLFFARLRYPSERQARLAVRALEVELELEEIAATRVDRCSTGMIQQLAVARALLGDPAVLLLDEPTRSLDEGALERFWSALDRRASAAVLIATHRTDDFEHSDERVDLASNAATAPAH